MNTEHIRVEPSTIYHENKLRWRYLFYKGASHSPYLEYIEACDNGPEVETKFKEFAESILTQEIDPKHGYKEVEQDGIRYYQFVTTKGNSYTLLACTWVDSLLEPLKTKLLKGNVKEAENKTATDKTEEPIAKGKTVVVKGGTVTKGIAIAATALALIYGLKYNKIKKAANEIAHHDEPTNITAEVTDPSKVEGITIILPAPSEQTKEESTPVVVIKEEDKEVKEQEDAIAKIQDYIRKVAKEIATDSGNTIPAYTIEYYMYSRYGLTQFLPSNYTELQKYTTRLKIFGIDSDEAAKHLVNIQPWNTPLKEVDGYKVHGLADEKEVKIVHHFESLKQDLLETIKQNPLNIQKNVKPAYTYFVNDLLNFIVKDEAVMGVTRADIDDETYLDILCIAKAHLCIRRPEWEITPITDDVLSPIINTEMRKLREGMDQKMKGNETSTVDLNNDLYATNTKAFTKTLTL